MSESEGTSQNWKSVRIMLSRMPMTDPWSSLMGVDLKDSPAVDSTWQRISILLRKETSSVLTSMGSLSSVFWVIPKSPFTMDFWMWIFSRVFKSGSSFSLSRIWIITFCL